MVSPHVWKLAIYSDEQGEILMKHFSKKSQKNQLWKLALMHIIIIMAYSPWTLQTRPMLHNVEWFKHILFRRKGLGTAPLFIWSMATQTQCSFKLEQMLQPPILTTRSFQVMDWTSKKINSMLTCYKYVCFSSCNIKRPLILGLYSGWLKWN